MADAPGVRALSLHMTLFNIFATVLTAYSWRVSGSPEQVIGTLAHNRSSLAFRETAGLFIELFPLRVAVDEGDSFRSLLRKVGASAQGLLKHALPGVSTLATARLVNVVLNYIHASIDDFAGMPVTVEWVDSGYTDPEHQLRLHVHDMGSSGELTLDFDFNADTFPAELRERAVAHFLALLDAAVADPERPLATLALATEAERRRWVVEYNETDRRHAPSPTVLASFRRQAERVPGAVALVQGDRPMTYAELDRRSDDLAAYLQERGGGEGAIFSTCLIHYFIHNGFSSLIL
jgi:non-ribosomal peptide synthetase component F